LQDRITFWLHLLIFVAGNLQHLFRFTIEDMKRFSDANILPDGKLKK